MNARTLASTLFGVAGVWMLAELIANAGFALDLLLVNDGSPTGCTPGFGAMLAGHFVVGLGLLLGRERLASLLFRDGEIEVPTATVLLDVGFRLAGVVIIARGIEQVAWHLASRQAAALSDAIVSSLPQGLALLLFGLGLVIGARPLAALLRRVRAAGQ